MRAATELLQHRLGRSPTHRSSLPNTCTSTPTRSSMRSPPTSATSGCQSTTSLRAPRRPGERPAAMVSMPSSRPTCSTSSSPSSRLASERIVEMRFVEERTQADIAAQIGVSQVQVSRLLRMAVDRLRQLAVTVERRTEHDTSRRRRAATVSGADNSTPSDARRESHRDGPVAHVLQRGEHVVQRHAGVADLLQCEVRRCGPRCDDAMGEAPEPMAHSAFARPRAAWHLPEGRHPLPTWPDTSTSFTRGAGVNDAQHREATDHAAIGSQHSHPRRRPVHVRRRRGRAEGDVLPIQRPRAASCTRRTERVRHPNGESVGACTARVGKGYRPRRTGEGGPVSSDLVNAPSTSGAADAARRGWCPGDRPGEGGRRGGPRPVRSAHRPDPDELRGRAEEQSNRAAEASAHTLRTT